MNYQKIYDSLIQKRRDNPITKAQIYCESHHILPRCLGGNDDKSNLVNLTAREHFIAHALLVQIYRQNKEAYLKMALAMTFFKCQSKDGKFRLQEIGTKINSRLFEKLTIAAKEYKSEYRRKLVGHNNPSYGRKWITNGIQNKLLLPADAMQFLKNNPLWHYGQKFVHRKSTKRKSYRGTTRKGIKLTLSEQERNRRREHCKNIGNKIKENIKNK